MDGIMLDDEILQKIYAWIDEVPLSRPKKNMGRDFSDGILAAEVVAFYFPKLVQMHNYSSANSVTQKQYNWGTLNRKVLKRLGFQLTKRDIDDIVQCKPGAVEEFLSKLQVKVRVPNAVQLGQDLISDCRLIFQIANYRLRRTSSTDIGNDNATSPVRDLSGHTKHGGDHINDDDTPQSDHCSEFAPKRSEVRDAKSKDDHSDDYPGSAASFTSKYKVLMMRTSHKSSVDHSDVQLELQEKTSIIDEQRETIQILEQKIQKLEQLVRLKDGKIQTLVAKLRTQK
ncbi:hypothetical protein AaE_011238 [Aphanomyces astaci]|uniref:Calponin-homology (CH) domain-containing protein n=1 Tax=Aphanomyces astaci TaxID=112090 RepID=A0A6A4ZRQ9_APHAT|nr:hypothetical protein AaE_011238 [Aphanomyces astaci]